MKNRILNLFLIIVSLGLQTNLRSLIAKEYNIVSEKEFPRNNNQNSPLKDELYLQNSYYLLGPGDGLNIKFIGNPELTDDFEILNDGNIQIPYVGNVFLDNLTLELAERKIKNLLSRELLQPEIQLKLIRKRPLKISLIGELERPGLYSLSQNENSSTEGGPRLTLSGMPTVVDAIQKAGGITQESDLRSVKISRRLPGKDNEYKTTNLDLMKLILEGDQSQNIYLFDGDIIDIKKAKILSKDLLKIASVNFAPSLIKINVIGEVNNPGLLEVSSNTLLNQGILYAGGPLNWRSDKGNVQLIRVNRNGTITKKIIKINLANGLSSDNNPPLKSGDTIILNRNLIAKSTDILKNVTDPISDVVTTWTLFKLIGQ